ncbi:MAG: hypothetical protein OHK0040_04260 [bacterium]
MSLFRSIENIKLFTLELEFDKASFYLFQKYKDNVKVNAFQNSFILGDIETVKAAKSYSEFNITFEIPFFLSISDTRAILQELELISANDVTLSYFLTSENIAQFREVIDFAVKFGIKKVVIPNPDIVGFSSIIANSFLTHRDLQKIAFVKDYRDKLHLQVHDYFLAKYLGLKDAELFKGCQAGTLMGYVLKGIVYPCKSIPLPFGSLFEEDFATIWKRGDDVMKKYDFAKLCKSCAEKDACKLGCPGTAFFLNNGEKDPLCEK